MRVLLIHNRYLQAGGEDKVFERERDLLRNGGHEVMTYERNNSEISALGNARVAIDTIWSRQAHSEIGQLIDKFRPDVLHAHNTFPLVSPAAFHAAHAHSVPVVQTLHNFRLMCLNATFIRDSATCRSCVGKVPWRGVAHRCYQGRFAQSAVLATSITVHRLAGTYKDRIGTYIALTNAARNEFVSAGLPASRIVVKPNFVPENRDLKPRPRANVLYVGRLSPEKGIATLAAVARAMPSLQFTVAGSGPSASSLSDIPNVTILGQLSPGAVLEQMRAAKCLVMPSHWPEGMPMTLLEAFSCGLPVVASDIGSLSELVEPGLTGLLFPVGDSSACSKQISTLLGNSALWEQISAEARARAFQIYGPASNLRMLEAIYAAVARTPVATK